MAPILALHDLRKRFGAVIVAEGIDAEVAQGEALGIIGPNGAGKSTLFGMITGTVAPNAGRVMFAGEDVTPLSAARRCQRGIARSFQIPQPFAGMSTFENVVVAARFGGRLAAREAERSSAEIVARCGLARHVNAPAGGLTLLQRKRLELARALASKPRLLLLDEVAGGLTEDECHALVALIRDVKDSGVTIVWIEHVVHALLAVVDTLAVLHGGRFIARGDPQTVIKSQQVAEIYMGIPAHA